MSLTKTGVSLSAFHKVTSSKINTTFDRAGKNGLLILTSDENCGVGLTPSPVNATDRVKTYATFADLAVEWDASCPAYQSAQASYAQGTVPSEVTVGFYDDAAVITNELNAVRDCYSNFYAFVTPNLKDDPRQLDVAAWSASFGVQHLYSALTSDPLTLDAADTTSIAYQINQMNFNTLVNYQDAALTGFLDAEAAGYITGRDFDVISNYTLFGGRFAGTAPSNITETQLGAIRDKNANAKVCITGPNINIYDGGRLGDGSFVDSCHKLCWLNIQLQEAQLAEQLADGPPRNSREGYQDYIDRYEEPLALALERDVIADYEITAPQYDDLSRSQIASREPVCLSASVTDNGSIHGSCIDVQFTL